VSQAEEVAAAAAVLAAHGLVDAFGHVSARAGEEIVMTPPRPLGEIGAGDPLPRMPLEGAELPAGIPKEGWIHRCIYARRPDVGGICRAQPPSVLACAGAGVPIRALHGQGAFLGAAVAVHEDARLVRDRALGEALAATLGVGFGVVMRGNGAVTVGASPGHAAARMCVLEASAKLNLAAASAGVPVALTEDELASWDAVADELLGRIWDHLRSAR
jgi:HCOMODA/2-hydroxy-3-carboxy-muconic semialdehyde decarboxylase